MSRPRRLRAVLGLLILAVFRVAWAAPAGPSIAIYYGQNPPVDLLSQFDWVVVEANHVKAAQLPKLSRNGSRLFAYVSVGEIGPGRGWAKSLGGSAFLGVNKNWNSRVVNLADPAWRQAILDKRIAPLWHQGYRGFFLDTLDSYRLFTQTPAQRAAQRQGLIALIKTIHERYPKAKLLLNRGFQVLDAVHGDVAGVAAESLFKGWDAAQKKYVDVSAADRKWLLEKLEDVKKKYHLPVFAIDYLPPKARNEAREDARRIAALGIVPWVTNAALDEMGVGLIEAVPRKVLMLYQLDGTGPEYDISHQGINLYAAMPLEYLGYVADYRSVAQPLPEGVLRGRYAGIVTWFNRDVPHPAAYRKWLLKQVHEGVPVAILADPGLPLDGGWLKPLGLTTGPALTMKSLHIAHKDAMLDFEGMPDTVPPGSSGVQATARNVTEHLVIADGDGHKLAPVVTGPWGGLALSAWVIQNAPQNGEFGSGAPEGSSQQARWIINPFAFYKAALHLKPMPRVDATTENGNRILTAHIDGDGFANRAFIPGTPFASQVIENQILKKFPIPIAVSVIEGEVGPHGLYPKLSPELEKIARSMFRLPNVELATHTFSHPFEWEYVHDGMPSGKYNLPIPGYKFSMKREIDGSVHYINSRLAPPGKKVTLVLWSGDALPGPDPLRRVQALGIVAMNGGNTNITDYHDSLTNVAPMTRPAGKYTQIYAPITNDNVYTNGYRSPHWGFSRVIQTFKLTNLPRRLKPITIYFHFFSGSRPGAVDAIAKVVRYALSRPVMPMFESRYCRLVMNGLHVGVARTLDGNWLISGARELRTLRLPPTLGWPKLNESQGVAGVTSLEQGRYVSLTGQDRVRLVLQAARPHGINLLHANGRIVKWRRAAGRAQFELRSEGSPLEVKLGGVSRNCTIHAPGAMISRTDGSRITLNYKIKTGHASIACH